MALQTVENIWAKFVKERRTLHTVLSKDYGDQSMTRAPGSGEMYKETQTSSQSPCQPGFPLLAPQVLHPTWSKPYHSLDIPCPPTFSSLTVDEKNTASAWVQSPGSPLTVYITSWNFSFLICEMVITPASVLRAVRFIPYHPLQLFDSEYSKAVQLKTTAPNQKIKIFNTNQRCNNEAVVLRVKLLKCLNL